MLDEMQIRQFLIASCHSSDEAELFFKSSLLDSDLLGLLVRIAEDSDAIEGDAPMQAAYWISQFGPDLLAPYEDAMLKMLPGVNGYAGSISMALGKIQSARVLPLIEAASREDRFDAWMFRRALEFY